MFQFLIKPESEITKITKHARAASIIYQISKAYLMLQTVRIGPKIIVISLAMLRHLIVHLLQPFVCLDPLPGVSPPYLVLS